MAKAIPKSPMMIPMMIITPSLPIKPKEVIKIPIPGTKLVKGRGSKIEMAKIKMKKPMILSKIPLVKKVKRGFINLSIR